MSQLYMLDTNQAIYLLKGRSAALRGRLMDLQPAEVACISVVTEAELRYGVAKSRTGAQQTRLLNWFLQLVAVHPWGRAEAAVYGRLRAKQEAMGKALGPLDMQIAAHAVSLGAVMVTNDKAFHYVAELLRVENWATDL